MADLFDESKSSLSSLRKIVHSQELKRSWWSWLDDDWIWSNASCQTYDKQYYNLAKSIIRIWSTEPDKEVTFLDAYRFGNTMEQRWSWTIKQDEGWGLISLRFLKVRISGLTKSDASSSVCWISTIRARRRRANNFVEVSHARIGLFDW